MPKWGPEDDHGKELTCEGKVLNTSQGQDDVKVLSTMGFVHDDHPMGTERAVLNPK